MFQNAVVNKQSDKNQKQLEKAGQLAYESISNFRTVTALGLQDSFYKSYEEELSVPRRNETVKAHTYGLSYGFSQSVIYFAFAASFTLGAFLIDKGRLTSD